MMWDLKKEKRMINTFISARECRATCTYTCTRRSKKPCLLINEIFLGQTLMIHLSQWSMRRAGDGSGGIQSRAEARGSLKATNLSNVLHAAIQTQQHSGVRNKQNEKSNWNFRIIHTYAPVPLTPIWCSDKLLFETQWNAPQEKNERKMGEWEVGKTRMRQESLWNTHVSLAFGNSFMMLCVYMSVAGSIWRHGSLSAFGFF